MKRRGLHGVDCITINDHEGLRAAVKATFSEVVWNRYQTHPQHHAIVYVSKREMRELVNRKVEPILMASDDKGAERLEQTVEKYRRYASHLSEWMETAPPEGFMVFTLPMGHRRRIRTAYMPERVIHEVKHCTEWQHYSQTKRRTFAWSVLYSRKSVKNGKRLISI